MSKSNLNRKDLQKLIRRYPKQERDGAPRDLATLLIYAVLEENTTSARAKRGLSKIDSHFVDFNDLRVSPNSEIEQTLGVSYPQVTRRADRIVESLNRVFRQGHTMDLAFLNEMGKRDVRRYIEGLHASPYVSRRLLLATGVHAIPVDSLIHSACVKAGIASTDTELEQLSSFLDRNVPAARGQSLFSSLRKAANQQAARDPYAKLGMMDWESEEAKRKRRRGVWAIATLKVTAPPGTAPKAAPEAKDEKSPEKTSPAKRTATKKKK